MLIKRLVLIQFLLAMGVATGSCSNFRGPGNYSGQGNFQANKPIRHPARFTAGSSNLKWPVRRAYLTQEFRGAGQRPHLGIDLASRMNTPVVAAHAGTVIYTGRGFRGYGRMVMLEQGKTWATLYAHLNKVYVEEGQTISRGQKLGAMGRTGNATGVHLHFELRRNKVAIDPLPFLPQ